MLSAGERLGVCSEPVLRTLLVSRALGSTTSQSQDNVEVGFFHFHRDMSAKQVFIVQLLALANESVAVSSHP